MLFILTRRELRIHSSTHTRHTSAEHTPRARACKGWRSTLPTLPCFNPMAVAGWLSSGRMDFGPSPTARNRHSSEIDPPRPLAATGLAPLPTLPEHPMSSVTVSASASRHTTTTWLLYAVLVFDAFELLLHSRPHPPPLSLDECRGACAPAPVGWYGAEGCGCADDREEGGRPHAQ